MQRLCGRGAASPSPRPLPLAPSPLLSRPLSHHRRFQRGLKRKALALIKKLRKAKKDAVAGEKPEAVRTHLRNMIVIPEMIGSVVGVYNGKTFNQVGAWAGAGAGRGGREGGRALGGDCGDSYSSKARREGSGRRGSLIWASTALTKYSSAPPPQPHHNRLR